MKPKVVDSRYVSKADRQKLSRDCRNRCCIARHIRVPQQSFDEAVPTRLHRHHMIYFSLGGPSNANNLIMVCPNCHELIHSQPGTYTVDRLRRGKQNWKDMKRVVPQTLYFQMPADVLNAVRVPFAMDTINLRYYIWTNRSTAVQELAAFIKEAIIRPIGRYCYYEDWFLVKHIRLALHGEPRVALRDDLIVREINYTYRNPLVARVSGYTIPRLKLSLLDKSICASHTLLDVFIAS
jgi:hypothetical protein